jgi:uncharacterized protein
LSERTAEIVSTLPVDVCVMTGDYRFEVFGTGDKVYPRMGFILGAVRARCGVLGILGNHDSAEIAMELARMGVHMLINDATELRSGGSSLWIAGVDDPHYHGCDDLGTALSDVPNDGFKVLLAHTPEIYEEARAAGIHLYLCGHTHAAKSDCPNRFVDRGQHPFETRPALRSTPMGGGVTVDCRVTPPPESEPPSCLYGTTVHRK